jgi:hypothetical protein
MTNLDKNMVAAIFACFNERAKGANYTISDIDWKKYGFYEIMFSTHICNTMRVYFKGDHIHLVWTKWIFTSDGRDREVETNEYSNLLYRHFDTTPAVVLAEFQNVVTANKNATSIRFHESYPGLFKAIDDMELFIKK